MLFASIFEGPESAEDRLRLQYEAAVRDYTPMIERICFGYAKTAADLEDLRQDALLNLWESMPAFKHDCSIKTWVYRLTLNSCVSSLRKSYRSVSTTQLSELYDSVDNDIDQKDMVVELHAAIGGLNPIDKAIMLLWLEEESYDAIAAIVGISKSNVAIRIHRAKEKLKSLLKE